MNDAMRPDWRRRAAAAVTAAAVLAALVTAPVLTAQVAAAREDLVTARTFFEEQVADRYAAIDDYQADVVIAKSRHEVDVWRWEGALSFKRPDLLRIDFTEPAGQVLVADGDLLTLYVAAHDYVVEQPLRAGATPAQTTLAAAAPGLRFLRGNYSFAYEQGPDPVALNDGSGQRGTRLLLERQVPEEQFSTIEITIDEDHLIRSIVGVHRSGERYAVEFRSVRIDQSIPDERFRYESPPDANVYHDVLFGEGRGSR